MGWLQNIFRNDRKLEEIEVEELKLLQQKSRELGKLLEDVGGIIELAIRDKAEKESAAERGRKPMKILLPRHHGELVMKLGLVEENLEEEIELTKDMEKREKRRKE